MTANARWAFVCGFMLCLGACHKQPRPANLAFVTDLEGTLEPCGCVSHPLGGVDRLASALDGLRQTAPTSLLVLGNTFMSNEPSSPALLPQERRKARVIGKWLNKLNPSMTIPGPIDHAMDGNTLAALRDDVTMPVLWEVPTQTVYKLGGVQVGIIGVAAKPDVANINQAAVSLRQMGAQLLVALVAEDSPDWRANIAQLKDIDLVVQGACAMPPFAQKLDNTIMVGAGRKGEYLGLLHVVPQGTGPWKFFDSADRQRQALQSRRDRLQAEVAKLTDGEAKKAREERMAELDKEIARVPTAPPETTPYFTWETIPMQKSIAQAPWAKQLLAKHNHDQCTPTLAETAQRPCKEAPNPNERYAGSQSCESCHRSAWEFYKQTPHAHAWATLIDAGKDCDLGCIGCHTVGYEKPGGFCRLQDASKFANVGCESCHGPAAGHVAAPTNRSAWAKTFVRNPDSNTCVTCHTSEHSDKYDWPSYRAKVVGLGHGTPLEYRPNP